MNCIRAFLLSAGFVGAAFAQHPRSVDEFVAQVPARVNTCAPVMTYEEWRNPGISVGADGFYLLTPGHVPATKRLSVATLRLRLLELPLDAWPCGRVVALMEQSIRSGNDDKLIDRNMEKLRKLLEDFHLESNLWPSA